MLLTKYSYHCGLTSYFVQPSNLYSERNAGCGRVDQGNRANKEFLRTKIMDLNDLWSFISWLITLHSSGPAICHKCYLGARVKPRHKPSTPARRKKLTAQPTTSPLKELWWDWCNFCSKDDVLLERFGCIVFKLPQKNMGNPLCNTKV